MPNMQLQARDLMNDYVQSVYQGRSIKHLAGFFLEHNISGAPVIDADHQPVGVVSVSDILKFENASTEKKGESLQACYREATGMELSIRTDLQSWSEHAEDNCTVEQIMAPTMITIEADEPLGEIARTLVENNIHRVFVTENQKIVGVISTMDIMRTLVP